jgi:predicted nuclease with TOPRIM domain
MTDILSILNLVLSVGLAIGGLAAFRHGFARTANEVQERVINALESEINALKDRLGELEKENARLTHVIATIRRALRRRGLFVSIDDELVSIRDRAGNLTQATRIQDNVPQESFPEEEE